MSVIGELTAQGQSIWFDYIQRNMIWTGALHTMVMEDDLRGVTSNPAIFNKAIGGSKDYEPAIRAAVARGGSPKDVYERIAITDIQMAADVLYSVYIETDGLDGYVSLEVSPYLANDTEGTIAEAKRLWAEVSRENVMIKIPATSKGLKAIESCIAAGINVNVTLLFAVEAYEAVAWAYIRGLEKRVLRGDDITRVASVASFFVSRIDALVDKKLDELRSPADSNQQSKIDALKGKIAIANAKVAYKLYQKMRTEKRSQALNEKGARPQRLLWASTSTKNPEYRDVLYIEELIGPDTVNTVPEKTYIAFKDHGRSEARLLSGLDEADQTMDELAEVGVSMKSVTDELLEKGVTVFADAFDELLGTVENRRKAILEDSLSCLRIHAPQADEELNHQLNELRKSGFIRRLWAKDETLFSASESEDRWGWLKTSEKLKEQLPSLKAFAEDISTSEVEHVVWLGTGGSSRSAEVFSRVLPKTGSEPALHFLDSTHPYSIARIEDLIDLDKTAFIVASKSGTTAEIRTLFHYFWAKAGDQARWYAITDPETELEALAQHRSFSGLLHGEANVGGRFSSLTSFGLGAPALLGKDLNSLLGDTVAMVGSCDASCPPAQNPGVRLGTALAVLVRSGRDKLSLWLSSGLSAFGPYLSQLIDESLGKDGKGLVVVDGEALAEPEEYGNDRIFVSMALGGEVIPKKLEALVAAGHPHLHIKMVRPEMIGQQFLLWQIAVATAAYLLKLNPFDQPNVEASKEKSRAFLASGVALNLKQPLLGEELLAEKDSFLIFGSGFSQVQETLEATLTCFVQTGAKGRGAYIALLPYLFDDPSNREVLQALRLRLRHSTQMATTLDFGPSYLHGSGQMHKGGTTSGQYVVITADLDSANSETAKLLSAQAAGDVLALREKGRNVLRIHLKGDLKEALTA